MAIDLGTLLEQHTGSPLYARVCVFVETHMYKQMLYGRSFLSFVLRSTAMHFCI